MRNSHEGLPKRGRKSAKRSCRYFNYLQLFLDMSPHHDPPSSLSSSLPSPLTPPLADSLCAFFVCYRIVVTEYTQKTKKRKGRGSHFLLWWNGVQLDCFSKEGMLFIVPFLLHLPPIFSFLFITSPPSLHQHAFCLLSSFLFSSPLYSTYDCHLYFRSFFITPYQHSLLTLLTLLLSHELSFNVSYVLMFAFLPLHPDHLTLPSFLSTLSPSSPPHSSPGVCTMGQRCPTTTRACHSRY